MPQPLYPQERTPVPTEYEAGWAPEPVSMLWRGKKSPVPVGTQNPGLSILSPRHYTNYTIPAPREAAVISQSGTATMLGPKYTLFNLYHPMRPHADPYNVLFNGLTCHMMVSVFTW
jgi:hypothetical protein